MTDDEDDRIDEIMRTIPEPALSQGHIDDGRLLAYRGQAVEDEEREAIETHLADCGDCRELLAAYAAPMPSTLADWAKAQPPMARPRARRGWVVSAAVVLAAAAGALLTLGAPEIVLPSYELDGPHGGVAAARGAPGESKVFVPTSRLQWRLEPASDAPPTQLRIFVEDASPGGRLREVSATDVQTGDTGVLLYEVGAGALFGAQYGARTVHLVIVAAPGVAAPFEGLIEELRRGLGPHRWLTSTVRYRANIEDRED